jgi:hypothetical protein
MTLQTVVSHEGRIFGVTVVSMPGPPGPPGDAGSGDGGFISSDANNRAKEGTDGGVFVLDDLNPSPLAYYILAKE